MSGDYTRITFKPGKNYSGVLKQQGRVDLDADWNELVDIVDRSGRAAVVDLAGRCVVSKETPDAFRITASGNTFTIEPGRMYVDGLLAEHHGEPPLQEWDRVLEGLRSSLPLTYDSQPYLPDPPPLTQGGPQLVYIDVWRRELTHIEDPDLLEKALGGPDTTTRTQTVWQVKVLEDDAIQRCESPSETWNELVAPSAGRLTTEAVAPPTSDDPCIISPAGGYRGLENRLYRVEIHTPGPIGTARFKWSRDNGSVLSSVEAISAGQDQLTVRRLGRDQVLRFQVGDQVEVLDDHTEFKGEAGHMGRITDIDEANRILTINPALPAGFTADPGRHTRVRRWDQKQNVDADGLLEVTAGSIDIEDGIRISFSIDPDHPTGEFKAGDYWVFAARTADGAVEELQQVPPRGIHHHYCRLALIRVRNSSHTPPDIPGIPAETGDFIVLSDCRPIAPPQTKPEHSELGIHITTLKLSKGPLLNDAKVTAKELFQGIIIVCDGEVDPATIGQPTCFVTLDIPYPFNSADRELWRVSVDDEVVGFQPLILAAVVGTDKQVITWAPTEVTGSWLFHLLERMSAIGLGDQVLAHLTLKGNFIWEAGSPDNYLDGEVFGKTDGDGTNPSKTRLRLPRSGDDRRGGDFEMWFWLVL